jgi:hypothetical protein
MASSPSRRVILTGARAPQWLAALTLLLVAAALAFAAILTPVARADAPTVTATVDSAGSTSTQTHIRVVGKGFPPSTPFTYTFGSFDPFQGTTDASGNAYAASTVSVVAADGSALKYCATITIEAGGSSASTAITVAATTDSEAGQLCGTPTASSTDTGSTPTVDATAAAQASATAAAAPTATTAPAAAPTDNSNSSPTSGLRARLEKLPLGLIGGGLAALFVVIILVVAVSRRGGDDYGGGYSSRASGYRPVPRPGSSGYRQVPPRGGPPRGPDRGGPTYGRRY